ncbi:NAD(P)/FAD-dependent oxidoreductase [Marinifilum caeruleilacunae]|uniref:FAD-binding oxidoreductase n=1 Tax=Marinifilum caeruleilacunae TaxID=2499076 RepID=A0ABX1WZ40_9BACT|nr:FAD-dependent oxidoreductase [Marinifilum caeruleilacunae]NOU61379.1 FAD-binding oxidoreductase [Marinifilum caeruleilacunae]
MNKKFLIVGQGIAGSLLAYNMYKAGLSFKIISSLDLRKASDVAAGLFNPLVFKRLTKSWMVDDCLPVMFETYRELEELLGHQFVYEKDILKPLSEKESEMWLERREQANFTDYISDIGINNVAKGLKGFQHYGKVTQSGYVDLPKMLRKLRKFFKKEGLIIDSYFNYKDLGFIDNQISWHGVMAETIVFCEGFRAIDNPYFGDLGFKPTKGELIEIECKELQEEYILNKNLFVMPVGNHRFKVGATYDWNHLDEETTEDAKQDLLSRLENLIDLPYKVINQWAGVRPTVSDRRPILGIHPLHEHIAIFNGLGTKGVMLAPYFAREMARFLSVNDYPLSKEIDIRRFLK